MLEYLPQDLRDAFAAARRRDQRRKSRLCVHVEGEVYPVLRWSASGFVIEGRAAPHLRGLVDVYDGPRHVCQCLIVATLEEGEELFCEFKRSTPVSDRPAVDFIRAEDAPAALLPGT